jgi:hypothetical protein
MNYRTLSATQLLRALENAGRDPNLNLIRACLDRRRELIPGLLRTFARGLFDDWPDDDDPRWYRTVHAGRLLIAFREPEALPIFGDLYRDHDEDLVEWFETDPYYFGEVAIPTFAKLLQLDTGGQFHYGRAMSSSVLAQIGLQFPETRERVLAALRATLPPLKEDGSLDWPADKPLDIDLWSTVSIDLHDLRDRVSLPQMLALFEREWIDEGLIGKEAFLASFEPAARPPEIRPFDILDLYRPKIRWSAAGEQMMSSPKVGRNDPCPCGSGKKYKKCHGRPGMS